jgi:hypothetical protein
MKRNVVSFRQIMWRTASLFLVAGLLGACNKKDVEQTPVPAAGLMAFNLAPDKEAVGIALSGSMLPNGPLSFTGFNGVYQNIFVGSREIESFDYRTDSSLAKNSYDFEDGNYYSLFVVGNNGVYRNITVKDDVDSNATTDKAYLRFVNAIPDSSAPLVNITSSGTSVHDASATFASVSSFIPVNAGEVKISVNGGNSIGADRTLTLTNGSVYTVLLVGLPGATDEVKKVQIRYIVNGTVPSAPNK